MESERYSLNWNAKDAGFYFYSEGPKGKIKKQVTFQPAHRIGKNVYNVLLGDAETASNRFNSNVISNNKDRKKIIDTVAGGLLKFMDFKPDAILLIQGNTLARTRLYQMAISYHWEKIELDFEVLGKCDDQWCPFRKGINFESFLVYKKIR